KNKFTSLFITLLLGLIVFVAAACNSDTTSSDDSTNSSGTEATGGTEESSVDGGELRVAFEQQPPTLDIHLTTSAATFKITRHIFETLVALDENYQPVPMLAESVETSDDGKTYTFNLR